MGAVMESLGPRRAVMVNMIHMSEGQVRLEFTIPARGLIGFRSEYLTISRGYGIMSHVFHGYAKFSGEISGRNKGAMVALEDGMATAYALHGFQERGIIFIAPHTEVYRGMIIGMNSREEDMDVNVCRRKQVVNFRAAAADEAIRLEPQRNLTLEQAMEFIEDDELVEVTPSNLRLRKRHLDPNVRHRVAAGKALR
jgi:GTP-binding protein